MLYRVIPMKFNRTHSLTRLPSPGKTTQYTPLLRRDGARAGSPVQIQHVKTTVMALIEIDDFPSERNLHL